METLLISHCMGGEVFKIHTLLVNFDWRKGNHLRLNKALKNLGKNEMSSRQERGRLAGGTQVVL